MREALRDMLKREGTALDPDLRQKPFSVSVFRFNGRPRRPNLVRKSTGDLVAFAQQGYCRVHF
jgi:hypothetical protein